MRYRAPILRQIFIVSVKVGKKERGWPRWLKPHKTALFGYTSFRNCSLCSCHNVNEFSSSMGNILPRLKINFIRKLRKWDPNLNEIYEYSDNSFTQQNIILLRFVISSIQFLVYLIFFVNIYNLRLFMALCIFMIITDAHLYSKKKKYKPLEKLSYLNYHTLKDSILCIIWRKRERYNLNTLHCDFYHLLTFFLTKISSLSSCLRNVSLA